MKYGQYIAQKKRPEWDVSAPRGKGIDVQGQLTQLCHVHGAMVGCSITDDWLAMHSQEHYIDYKGLKDLIKACAAEGKPETSFSPRTTSLTIQRYNTKKDSPSERFFAKLEQDVRMGKFVIKRGLEQAEALRASSSPSYCPPHTHTLEMRASFLLAQVAHDPNGWCRRMPQCRCSC